MTAVLAIDTADRTTGVAVAMDGRVRAEVLEASAFRHSERVFHLVDEALCGAGVDRSELDCIAVTVGPGSFTGLRVGVATAKGIAFALGIPAAGVSTLVALARGVMPFPGVVVPVLDARKSQVYAAAYRGLSGDELLVQAAWDPRSLARALDGLDEPCLILGSGLEAYGDVFAVALGKRLLAAPSHHWHVNPREVALLGNEELRRGRAGPAGKLAPSYHRLSEAQRMTSTESRP